MLTLTSTPAVPAFMDAVVNSFVVLGLAVTAGDDHNPHVRV